MSTENKALLENHEYNYTVSLRVVPNDPYFVAPYLVVVPPLSSCDGKKKQMAAAASALLPDYAANEELTVFTALDSEDFNE